MPSDPRCRQAGRRTPSSEGFTLLELAIAVTLLATSLMIGVLSGQSNLRTMFRSLNMSSQEGLIEEDLAQIRRITEAYTWCTGAGTTTANSDCGSKIPLSQDYYFPNVPPPPTPPGKPETPPPEDNGMITAFTEACSDDRLTSGLLKAINDLPRPDGLSLERQVGLLNAKAAPGEQTHAIRIRYLYLRPAGADPNDSPPIDRDVVVVPTVAAWCP